MMLTPSQITPLHREVWKQIQTLRPDIYDLESPETLPYKTVYIEAIKEWIEAGFYPQVDFNNQYTKFRILPRVDTPNKLMERRINQ